MYHNKGGYRKADLRLCFCICKTPVLSLYLYELYHDKNLQSDNKNTGLLHYIMLSLGSML